MTIWDEARLRQLISDQVEESLTLDYKAAAALGVSDKKKKEISKDVSAMANSAGGVLVYGIAEHDNKDKRHIPAYLDPINRLEFSKERLEQIINNIRPRIENVVIHPVALSSRPTDVVYVVEVPQSMTAHQATDYRYYKRYNFESVPMDDYEVRDIMARAKHPILQLEPFVSVSQTSSERHCHLYVRVTNISNVFAQYVSVILWLPKPLLHPAHIHHHNGLPHPTDGRYDSGTMRYVQYTLKNTVQDILSAEGIPFGPARFDPILPQLSHTWTVRLADEFALLDYENQRLWWEIYADSATKHEGYVEWGAIRQM